MPKGTYLKRISAEQGTYCWNDKTAVMVYSRLMFCVPDRNQLKASYEMSSEVQGTLVEDIGMQV